MGTTAITRLFLLNLGRYGSGVMTSSNQAVYDLVLLPYHTSIIYLNVLIVFFQAISRDNKCS